MKKIPIDVLLFLRDQLWRNGEVTIAGMARIDRTLDVPTYKDEPDDDGGVRRASPYDPE